MTFHIRVIGIEHSYSHNFCTALLQFSNLMYEIISHVLGTSGYSLSGSQMFTKDKTAYTHRFLIQTGPKKPKQQPHNGGPFTRGASQHHARRRELPQRTCEEKPQPSVVWLAAKPGPLAFGGGGLPGPLPGFLQASPQPRIPGRLQPGLQAPAVSQQPQHCCNMRRKLLYSFGTVKNLVAMCSTSSALAPAK